MKNKSITLGLHTPSDGLRLRTSRTKPRRSELIRGTVKGFFDSGEVLISIPAEGARTFKCDILCAGFPLSLAIGDCVLVFEEQADKRGVILGKIAHYDQTPGTASLSLKCGISSIEMRADGKIMLFGTDILLRAKRTARVKAGTVSIN